MHDIFPSAADPTDVPKVPSGDDDVFEPASPTKLEFNSESGEIRDKIISEFMTAAKVDGIELPTIVETNDSPKRK